MQLTIHTITRHTVQVLTKRGGGGEVASYITVRLYDDDNNNRGVAVFADYGSEAPPKPTGSYRNLSATAHLDVSLFSAYMDILRLEKPVYLKISWTQHGKQRTVSQISIDTKREVIGEYFEKVSSG